MEHVPEEGGAEMIDPRDLAWRAVDAMLKTGAKKHRKDAWQNEPVSMHIQKGARHGITAELLTENPDYCRDPETAVQHLEQAICRYTMALAILRQKEQDKGLKQCYDPAL
jgi:hypothetical protein